MPQQYELHISSEFAKCLSEIAAALSEVHCAYVDKVTFAYSGDSLPNIFIQPDGSGNYEIVFRPDDDDS